MKYRSMGPLMVLIVHYREGLSCSVKLYAPLITPQRQQKRGLGVTNLYMSCQGIPPLKICHFDQCSLMLTLEAVSVKM